MVTAIWDCLVEEYMPVPTTEDWREIAENFQERWNFPLCCGALDGKHVTLSPYQHWILVFQLQGNFLFGSSCCCGCPVLLPCNRCWGVRQNQGFWPIQPLVRLFVQVPCNSLLTYHFLELRPLRHVFVADEAFPLRRNLMRPFPGRMLPKGQRVFNHLLSWARLVVECAFRILSSQWRVYRRPMEVHPELAERCVKAICVLHNVLRRTSQTPAGRASIPVAIGEVEPLPGLGRIAANNSAREAIRLREMLTSFFSAEGAVSWQDSV